MQRRSGIFCVVLRCLAVCFTVLMARPADAEERVFDCVIDPALVVKVGSPVAGLLEAVYVKRGDIVRRGQKVARIETSVEAATVALNRARAKGTAEIKAQETRLKLARKQLERAAELFKRKVVSEAQIDERRAAVEISGRELARFRLQRRLAELELARSQRILQRRTILSPIDGVVTQRLLSSGEFVHPESHVVVLAKLDPLHVEAFLPVALYGRITEGMTAKVKPDQPIGGEYIAEITVVDQVFDPASGTFGVRLALANPGNHLPGGQRCKVAFKVPSADAFGKAN